VLKYASTSVSSSLSSTGMCGPNETPVVVCYAGIRWGTLMSLMQLQQNTSRNQMGHIDVSDTVAAKHKLLSTRMDPLQRN
jgi:hypothetical protein